MANLKEQEKWEDGIYQIEENDPVLGGAEGVTNRPAKQLANRTAWLKKALSLLGLKAQPKTLTATSTNKVDEDGHTHEIAKASLTQQGITKLNSAVNSASETEAATPKAVKTVKDQLDSVQRSQANYILTSKKSSAVNSNSADNVATSSAVKTAYDKGVEAKGAADTAQRTADNGVSKATAAQNTANSAVTKADNAQRAADNANNNANNRVAKSGDTMTGTLTIENNEPRVHGKKSGTHKWFIGLPNANTDYPRFHNYANDTWMELNSGNIVVNKPLYLGNYPLPSSLTANKVQFRWNNNALELKVDNSELGYLHTSIKAYVETNVTNNNYSGLNIIRKGTSGNFWARFEALPDRRWKFATENGATIHLKNQNGNILLDSDISHATNGNNKAKVASEFALGELNKKFATVVRKDYSKTIKGTAPAWDSGTSKNISVTGYTAIYPDGRVEQYFYFRNFRIHWFELEQARDVHHRIVEIPIQFWTAMPNKITWIEAHISRTNDTNIFPQRTVGSEASEWNKPIWAFEKQGNTKDRASIYTRRLAGDTNETVDMFIKVEGY